MAALDAQTTVTNQLVSSMNSVSNAIAQAGGAAHASATENKRMADYCTQLNTAVDGLNIAYDEETGLIKDLNTGELMNISTLQQQIRARTELAKNDAGAEQYNALLAEQVQIQQQLALIEQEREEIKSAGYSAGNEADLLNDLQEQETAYLDRKREIATQLSELDTQMAQSSQVLASQTNDSYLLMESAVTSSGESIAQVAAQWGVSTVEILTAMQEQGISLDEWVSSQQEAWEEYQVAVSEKTAGVVNSFQEIPEKFSMSAEEMLGNLQANKERYAAWEANMAEITRLLGPTAAEEFSKLGPEANSAIEEILGSADLLAQYQEIFGVTINEATGAAIEAWDNPDFIGAPSTAITEAGQQCRISIGNQNFPAMGEDVVGGLIKGMNNKKGELKKTVTGMAGGVANSMRNTLAVRSPSRVMIDIFQNVMQGAINGMTSMEGKTFRTASNIALGVADKLTLSPDQAGLANARLLALSSTSLAAMPSVRSAHAAADRSGGDRDTANLLRKTVELLDEYLPEVAGMQVVLDTGAAVGGMAPAMDQALGRRARMKARG